MNTLSTNQPLNQPNSQLTKQSKDLSIDQSFKVPIAANWKDVCLQSTSKSHSYHLKIWPLL